MRAYLKMSRAELVESIKENILDMSIMINNPKNIGEEEYVLRQFIAIFSEAVFRLGKINVAVLSHSGII